MEKLKARLKHEGGFTLVEMLIVVALIAILIAISIPAMSESLEKAKIATDKANERSAMALAIVKLTTKEPGDTELVDGAVYCYEVTNTQGELKKEASITGNGYGQSKTRVDGYIKITYAIKAAGNTITLTWAGDDVTGTSLVYPTAVGV